MAGKDKIPKIYSEVVTYFAENLQLKIHLLEDKVSDKTMISNAGSGVAYLGHQISKNGLKIHQIAYKNIPHHCRMSAQLEGKHDFETSLVAAKPQSHQLLILHLFSEKSPSIFAGKIIWGKCATWTHLSEKR